MRDAPGKWYLFNVRLFLGLIAVAACAFQSAATPPAAAVRDLSHTSQVLGGERTYRVFLPPAYDTSQKRYPVVYWFHGYEQGDELRESLIAGYVAAHDLIVVKTGPVETVGEYPLYFPELADRVDHTLRTLADRNHRGVAGFATGGFMALWVAGKYPDLVSSASSIMGSAAAQLGPRDLDTEVNLADTYANYEGVRTRIVDSARDPLAFYHERLNAVWLFARTGHTAAQFDPDNAQPEMARTLDFHMHAFATPLPKPAMFDHADVYPNFSVWGWEVVSDRKEPGYTVLENVGRTGFRSAVREWIPGGTALPDIKLTLTSAPLYPPGSAHPVSFVRLRDGQVRHVNVKADAQGRLSFDLNGDAYEVGVSAEPVLTITGFEVADAAWATAGAPVKLRVRFLNKGAVRSGTAMVQWTSPDAGVKFGPAASRIFGLAPGESASIPVVVTVADPARAFVEVNGVEGAVRMPFQVPLFPRAELTKNFHISDGQTLDAWQHAISREEVTLGDGNGDGHAAPGETFVVLLPDGDLMRAAELFTNDPCMDTSIRGQDSWNAYDRAGVSAVYTLAVIRPECAPGHVVRALARVQVPDKPQPHFRYAQIEFPVWYRPGEEPK